jgi:xanthine/CO dehydrogenase XdhC/CoxF family maturation factor
MFLNFCRRLALHLGLPALLEFRRKHDGEDLVLATIIGTEGSTYRKPGAMMLIARDGDFEGMISGGCLEGDLLEHASGVFGSGKAAFVTYDMSADEDLIWSLGIGCDGVIHLLLQRLDGNGGLAALRQIEASHDNRDAVLLAMVTNSEEAAPGTLALVDQAGTRLGGDVLLQELDRAAADWPDWRSRVAERNGVRMMLIHMPVQTRVLICGAGPDAVPVAEAFSALGWQVFVADHRSAFARKERFPHGCKVTHQRQAELHKNVDLDEIEAAVIMTHHLESDAEYLAQLCGRPLSYLGVLGPMARKARLRDMAGCTERPLFGPVGLDIGAELPASIALSIAAEVHAVLNRRDGRSLAGPSHE